MCTLMNQFLNNKDAKTVHWKFLCTLSPTLRKKSHYEKNRITKKSQAQPPSFGLSSARSLHANPMGDGLLASDSQRESGCGFLVRGIVLERAIIFRVVECKEPPCKSYGKWAPRIGQPNREWLSLKRQPKRQPALRLM